MLGGDVFFQLFFPVTPECADLTAESLLCPVVVRHVLLQVRSLVTFVIAFRTGKLLYPAMDEHVSCQVAALHTGV